MEMPETIADDRLDQSGSVAMPTDNCALSPPWSDDEEDFDHPIPPVTETWDEHIAELRRRIAERAAGVPGMSVEEVFAALDTEMGWNISKAEK